MIYLIDTNVLLRSVQKTHSMYEDVKNAVNDLLNEGNELCVIAQNLIEFWAVATRPQSSNGLGLSIEEAQNELNGLKQIFTVLPDTPEIFVQWEALVIKHRVMGKPSHDARIVAAMNVHVVNNLLTFNTDDFKRYTNINAVDPRNITTA